MDTVIILVNGKYEIAEYDYNTDTYIDVRTGRVYRDVILIQEGTAI